MTSRRVTAIHEAGHAVVGRAVTLPCGGASIRPDDGLECDGHAAVADADMAIRQWELREKFRDHASVARARIITAQAGCEAEAEILGTEDTCDEADREVAEAHAEDLGVSAEREPAALDRLRRVTRQLVRRHRADIERVAAALEARETLTGEEIDAMLPPGFMTRPVTWALALASEPVA